MDPKRKRKTVHLRLVSQNRVPVTLALPQSLNGGYACEPVFLAKRMEIPFRPRSVHGRKTDLSLGPFAIDHQIKSDGRGQPCNEQQVIGVGHRIDGEK